VISNYVNAFSSDMRYTIWTTIKVPGWWAVESSWFSLCVHKWKSCNQSSLKSFFPSV